jgi:hypothetical protein
MPGLYVAKGGSWQCGGRRRPPTVGLPATLWQLQAGETVDDNRPAGVNVVNYADFDTGLGFGQTLAAIRSAQSAPYYVRLGAGTFHLTDFSFGAGVGQGKGYQDINTSKYWGGLIGAGADKTFVVVDPAVMSTDQLSGVSAGNPNPVQMMVFYAGSSGLSIPTFFSGITFRGNFQQLISLNGLTGTAPAPYSGINLINAKAGSRVQFCRFQGFGYAAQQSPPYELGAIQSNSSDWTLYRTEIDGRLAPEIDPTQPYASGGLMWNYEAHARVVDSWLHHTRRSGFAMHDHPDNTNDTGIYECTNFTVEHCSEASDSYAESAPGFANSNVEGLRRTFTYTAPKFTATASRPYHIAIATPNGATMCDGMSVADPVIGDSVYDGCLAVRYVRTPNGSGDSPYWTLFQSGGVSALPLTVTKSGVALTPVLSSSFVHGTHTPANSFVVIVN